MTDEEKFEALKCILTCGEDPQLFKWNPLDFVEEMYYIYIQQKEEQGD